MSFMSKIISTQNGQFPVTNYKNQDRSQRLQLQQKTEASAKKAIHLTTGKELAKHHAWLTRRNVEIGALGFASSVALLYAVAFGRSINAPKSSTILTQLSQATYNSFKTMQHVVRDASQWQLAASSNLGRTSKCLGILGATGASMIWLGTPGTLVGLLSLAIHDCAIKTDGYCKKLLPSLYDHMYQITTGNFSSIEKSVNSVNQWATDNSGLISECLVGLGITSASAIALGTPGALLGLLSIAIHDCVIKTDGYCKKLLSPLYDSSIAYAHQTIKNIQQATQKSSDDFQNYINSIASSLDDSSTNTSELKQCYFFDGEKWECRTPHHDRGGLTKAFKIMQKMATDGVSSIVKSAINVQNYIDSIKEKNDQKRAFIQSTVSGNINENGVCVIKKSVIENLIHKLTPYIQRIKETYAWQATKESVINVQNYVSSTASSLARSPAKTAELKQCYFDGEKLDCQAHDSVKEEHPHFVSHTEYNF